MFGRLVWPDGRPVANAGVYVPGAIGSTDDNGYFQIEAGIDEVLKVQNADGHLCQLPLDARPSAQGYAALGTLICSRRNPALQMANATP